MVLAFVPVFAAILTHPIRHPRRRSIVVRVRDRRVLACTASMIDIWYMLIFGVVGYVFKKLDYPLAPLVLALGASATWPRTRCGRA